MKIVTHNKLRLLFPMIGWTILEYSFRGIPYLVSLGIVWEIFTPLQYSEESFNIKRIVFYWFCLLIAAGLTVYFNKRSYTASLQNGNNLCAIGRLCFANHIRNLSMGFFQTQSAGKIGNCMISDFENIEILLNYLIPQIIGGIAEMLGMFIFLTFFNWKLALISAITIPISIPFIWLYRILIQRASHKQQENISETNALIIEYIQGIRYIKSFNIGGTRFERIQQSFKNLRNSFIRLESIAGPTFVLTSFVLNASIPIVILVGYTFFICSELSLLEYILFLMMGTKLCEPLIQAVMFLGLASYMGLSIERIDSLKQIPEMTEGEIQTPINKFDIEFKKVSFAYLSRPIIKDLSIKIPEKSLTAIIGFSGSGKTTLLRLISRFWDVQQAEILINGINIKEYKSNTLLNSISVVFQDVYLFNDTIYNNIKIGTPLASEDDILYATSKAHVLDFANLVPDGLKTYIKEGGLNLSGGEKQRISIARAILKNAPLILLDEPTASLDSENEWLIQQSINELVKDKTVIMVSHRLPTIVHADKIILLKDGQIECEGTHEILLQTNQLYAQMWQEYDDLIV